MIVLATSGCRLRIIGKLSAQLAQCAGGLLRWAVAKTHPSSGKWHCDDVLARCSGSCRDSLPAQHSFSSPMNNKTMDRLNAGAEKVHKSTVPWREPCDVGEPPRRRGCTVCKSPSSSSRRVKSGIHDPRAPVRVCTRCDAAQGGRLHRAGRQRPPHCRFFDLQAPLLYFLSCV